MSKRVSDLSLEQFLLNELPAGEHDEIQRHLAVDAGLRQRLRQLEADQQSFASDPRAGAVLNKLAPKAQWPQNVRRLSRWISASIGAAALVILVPVAFQQTAGPDTRVKGGSTLEPLPRGFTASVSLEKEGRIAIFARQKGQTIELSDGTPVHGGDRVQVAVNIGRARHALLLSIDGSGHVTLQAPDSLKSSLLGDGTPKLLPFAYQLDNAPYFEQFVLITGSGPLDAQSLWNDIAAQTAAWLPGHPGMPPVLKLDSGLSVSTFDLLKVKENP